MDLADPGTSLLWPAGVERQVGDRLDELLFGHAVFRGVVEVEGEPFGVPLVRRLRSRDESSGRVRTSPNRTSSVKCTRPGAKSPNIFRAPDGSFLSGMGSSCSGVGCG